MVWIRILFIFTVEYFPPCLTTVDGGNYEFYVRRDIFRQPVIIAQSSGSLLSLTPFVTAAPWIDFTWV